MALLTVTAPSRVWVELVPGVWVYQAEGRNVALTVQKGGLPKNLMVRS